MKPFSYRDSVEFHGHSGPFLALGYKAGEYVMEKLAPERIKDIECSIVTVGRTPYTCIIDGIQCSTCCTFGKVNLELRKVSKESAEIIFRSRQEDKKIKLVLKSSTLSRALNSEDSERKVEWIINQPVDSLFEIEEKY